MLNRRAFALLAFVAGLTGCAPLLSWVEQNGSPILAIIQDAESVLQQQVERLVAAYFAAHPDPAKQSTAQDAIAKVQDVIDGITSLLSGGVALTDQQLAQAEQDFTKAWGDLAALLASLGISVAKPGEPAHMAAGAISIRAPLMLKLTKLVKGAK